MNIRILLTRIGFASVVVCCLSTLGAAHAQHPLDAWVRRTVPGPNSQLNSIAYGNGMFVAVGNNSFVARSTDGANWTTSTAGSFGNLVRIRYLNGQFVAVGSSDKMVFSSNGAAWTSSTLPASGFSDVALGNGLYVLAGNTTWVSSDGVNWTQTHLILTRGILSPYETILDTVVFGNGGFLGLSGGGFAPLTAQTRKSVFSTNGVDWMEGGLAPTSWGPGTSELLLIDGLWLGTSAGEHILYGVYASTNNGANWYRTLAATFSGFGGPLAFGQGNYVWVENYVNFRIASGTEDFSWQWRYTETSPAVARGAAFGNGTFVLAGDDGATGASYILQSGNISGAPIIFQEPQDRGAVAMNPASFTVQAVGASPMTYQWYKNGSSIANATNATFTIASVETGDIGGYHAVIANSFGSVTSRVAQLTVAFLDINCYAGVSVLGVPGRTYRIEASPAAGSPNWQTVTNLVLPQSPYVWIDYESPSLPSRIYRASELP